VIVPLLIVQGLFLARASVQDCRPCEPMARECCSSVGA